MGKGLNPNDMKVLNDLVKSTSEILPAEKELVKRLSRYVSVDWDMDDLSGFMAVLSSIKYQAEVGDMMVLYSALNPTTLTTLVLGIQMRDGME